MNQRDFETEDFIESYLSWVKAKLEEPATISLKGKERER
jgi:hypothetical protein